MGREHEGGARRDLAHVVDEDDALAAEFLHHQAIVHDLVVAVDGGLKDANHPGERLDGHLDAGTEAAGLRQEDDLHATAFAGRERVLSRSHRREG